MRYVFKILCAVEEQEAHREITKQWSDGSCQYYDKTNVVYKAKEDTEIKSIVLEFPIVARSLEDAERKIARYFAWEVSRSLEAK
ncbi:MAG: hypothetical protein WC761_00965 [Candidatus Paceibacterota bacterium]